MMINSPDASIQQSDTSSEEAGGGNVEYQSALDKFPVILNKVSLMWGTRELDKFIHKLIMDSRDGSRQGFPMDAAEELLFLAECNKIIRAIDASAKLNISLKDAYRMVDSGDQAHMNSGSPWGESSSKDAAQNHDGPHPKGAPMSSAAGSKSNTGPAAKKGTLFWVVVGLVVLVVAKIAMTLVVGDSGGE